MRQFFSFLKLLQNFVLDALRYAKHSSHPSKALTLKQTEARLLQKARSIEKGLAMPDPRHGFGKAPLVKLNKLWKTADELGLPATSAGRRKTADCLAAYIAHHEVAGVQIPAELIFVRDLAAKMQGTSEARAFRVARSRRSDSLLSLQ